MFCKTHIFGICILLLSETLCAEIYRWSDENGRVHFTDKKQVNRKADNVSDSYKVKDPFAINITGKQYNIPLKTKGTIRNSILRMGAILSDKIGIQYKDNAHINVIIFGDERGYLKYGGKKGTGGFYSKKKNEAVVKRSYNVNSTLKTVVHETSHLLLSYNYGNTPRWLDEGLAEYFEGMKLSFNSVEIPTNARWNKKLEQKLLSHNLYSLKEYVSLSARDWIAYNNANDNLGYAYGWSIISFLMSSAEGQSVLKHLFSGLKNSARNNEYSFTVLQRFFPGGFVKFEEEWMIWLYQNKKSTFH
jgi:Peptidase MA superfamily/Domain of unknown function (DUF4124)